MATAMTTGAAVTGMRAWVASHRPPWVTARGMRLFTAAILALGVLASGTHLAPNASGPATARAAATDSTGSASSTQGAGIAEVFGTPIAVAVAAANVTDTLKAIEGSLIYLGAKYESEAAAKKAAESSSQPSEPPPADEGVGSSSALPPASAGTNGTPRPPLPQGVGGSVVAHAPAPPGAGAEATATYVSGIALAPPSAPERIAGAINAANTIVGQPYVWGGGHASFYSRGYDCSGAVSFALAGGGFLSSPLASSQLESWGAPGPGRWLTIYASPSHAYAVIAGLRWDTVGDASGTGPRWHLAGAVPDGFVARHPPGY
jgi:cell wall-associated NlpC family hydrolase